MRRRALYPIFLDIKHRLVVVVGGGTVAERKVGGLLQSDAEVRVVAPQVTAVLEDLYRRHQIEWIRREFDPEDLKGACLAFAATNNPAVNTRVCQICDWQGVLVNRAESPEASDFIVPSIVRRGALAIAVSTGGASPWLASRIRRTLEGQFGIEYEEYADLLEMARAHILKTVDDQEKRSALLKVLAEDDETLRLLAESGSAAAWARMQDLMKAGPSDLSPPSPTDTIE